ncbi:MAG: acyl carrier protein [Planctomycetaceae bacterium]|nr:acyl carrier protein [Planctomycetaceae bacterium]
MASQTHDKVVDIVAEQLGVDKDKITPASNFINDLGADSLDLVEMVMEFESQFGIRIPEDQTDKIQTVGEAIEAIDKAMAA